MKKKKKTATRKKLAELTLKYDADSLIDDVMANFPEYSSESLRCIDFDYKGRVFEFWDCEVTPKTAEKSVIKPTIVKKLELTYSTHENAVVYILKHWDLRRGMDVLLKKLFAGELAGIGEYVCPNFRDPGNWDAWAADALVQCAIFGDVIYG